MGCGGPRKRARRALPMRTAKPCCPDILEAGVKLAVSPVSDGGTVIAGEITEQPYKPLRGECRMSRCDRGACTQSIAAALRRPVFPAPSERRVEEISKTS